MDKTKILKELLHIKEKYKDEITKIGLFGSVARDEDNHESDIDVVIEQKHPDLFLLGRIKLELEEKLNKQVDIIRLRKDLNPFLRKRIERDSIYL